MKKIIYIAVALLLVAAILFITLRKKPNETINTPAVDSSQVYKTDADTAHKVYVDADSASRGPITDSARAAYKSELIRKIIAG